MNDTILFVGAEHDGAAWYRMDVPAAWLRRHGRAVRVVRNTLRDADFADVGTVLLQRIAAAPALLRGLEQYRQRGVKVVYELDDDIWHMPAWNPWMDRWTRAAQRDVEQMIAFADVTVVTTPALAALVGTWAREVVIIPNAIEVADVPPALARTKAGLRIGWAGGVGHGADMHVAWPAIQRLLADRPDVTMVFFGANPVGATAGPQLELHPFVHASDLFHLYRALQCDVWIAPLKDHQFNRSRSAVKALEAAALGLPVLVSDQPAYREVIEQGLALGVRDGDWGYALAACAMPDADGVRAAMGQRARTALEAWHTMDATGPRWDDLLTSFVSV